MTIIGAGHVNIDKEEDSVIEIRGQLVVSLYFPTCVWNWR